MQESGQHFGKVGERNVLGGKSDCDRGIWSGSGGKQWPKGGLALKVFLF